MVYCFHYVIHIEVRIRNADGVCLKDVACLLMSEATSLDVIRVVGEINLGAVIYSSTDFSFLFFPQPFQKWTCYRLALFGQRCIGGNVPCFSDKDGPLSSSRKRTNCGRCARKCYAARHID